MTWGVAENGVVTSGARLPHADAALLASELLALQATDLPIVVASVNPRPLANLERSLAEKGCRPFQLLQAGLNWNPQAHVDRPSEVGVDRLVNARAFGELYPKGGIVVDHGTTLTIDYVAPEGIYGGGTIVPGIVMSTRTLAERTALIPQIDFERPASVVGTNTADCIRAGLYFGLVGLAEAIVARVRAEKGAELPVVVTGGDSEFLASESSESWNHRPWLTLEGIALAANDSDL